MRRTGKQFHALTEWHPHFALIPVLLCDTNEWVWLETIWRCGVPCGCDIGWYYRSEKP